MLTVSDTRRIEDDRSGDTLVARLSDAGHRLAGRAIVPDEVARIRAQVEEWLGDSTVDVVLTTGGTGFTGRDVTPEALEPLFEKRMDGFSAVFHRISYDKIGTSTLQSRATAGSRGRPTSSCCRLPRRLPGRLGRHPRPATRLPAPPLQLRRDHAAARRASAAGVTSAPQAVVPFFFRSSE